MLDEVPNAYRIWKSARRYLDHGDLTRAKWCENLIKLLHDSYVPAEAHFGDDVRFGYGGIGVIVHKDCEIGDKVTLGSGVTLGGKRGKGRLHSSGRLVSVPKIENYAYIATGAKLLGGIIVGKFSIVGANSVVTHDVPPFSVVGGVPAKILANISEQNLSKFRAVFLPLRSLSDADFLSLFQKERYSAGLE